MPRIPPVYRNVKKVGKTYIMKIAKKVITFIIVLAVLAAGAWMVISKKRSAKPAAGVSEVAKPIPAVLTQVREMVFEDRVMVTGNVEAKNTALVSARIAGTLDAIYVDEGDTVVKGETKLFMTDSLKLTKAVEIAAKNLSVAQFALKKAKATLEKDQAQYELDLSDMRRYDELAEKNIASKHEIESQRSKLDQARAEVNCSKASVDLARAKEELSESHLAMAKKDLSDALVIAPINGRVSERRLEPGEMAGAGTPVLRIDDLSVVEISAFLPEKYYSSVIEKQTEIRVTVNGMDVGDTVVSTKNPTIHPKLRTFEIKALLRRPSVGVVPGARADLAVVLSKQTGLGVPTAAVVRRGKAKVFFTVRDGLATMVPVTTGLDMDGWLEVKGPEVSKGMPVVRMGQSLLNEGSKVVEVKEDTEE